MKVLNSIVLAILIIGAINWGCIGLFNVDLVATIFGGANSMLSKIIYTLVGISGLWAFSFF
ncbi:MAG: DUF378 domain-containing protein [Clostridia bacterium]|nr:DUF378 domain-containing protein [Clostridia bacterium]MDD4387145.1 DUF378 domain-containing protein [Clostridia bacterium]